jgi:hypothetical protein
MGKHVKKKTESIRPAVRQGSRSGDPYGDWFSAAGRELDFDEVFFGTEDMDFPEPESSAAPSIVEAEIVSAPMKEAEPVFSPEDEPTAPSPEPDLFSDPDLTAAAQELLSPGPEAEEVPRPREEKPRPAPRKAPPARPEEARRSSGGKRPDSGRSPSRPSGGKRPPARKRRRRKKKGRAFRKGLRIYIIIMLVLILAICAALWVFLTKWQGKKDAEAAAEAARQEELLRQREAEEAVRRAPQQTFETWLAQTGPDYWTDMWFAKAPTDLDDHDAVRAWMQEHFGAAEPFRATEYTAEAPVYVLREGDVTLARITLSGGGTDWNISGVELLTEGKQSASVTAITGSRVFCNGRELGSEYITETASPFTFAPLADKLVNPLERITYSVEGLLLPVELTAEPPAGQKLTQTSDGDFLPVLEGAAAEAMAKRAVDFTRSYQFYILKGSNNTYGNLDYALSFLTPGTQAYSDLRGSAIGIEWNPVFNNIDTSNTVASDVVIWADNCCSIDVKYDATYTHNDGTADHSEGTMRLYYLKDNAGNYYISNFET